MYEKCECFVMQMLYVCVHPVTVINASFCMTYSLLLKGDNMEEAYYIIKISEVVMSRLFT